MKRYSNVYHSVKDGYYYRFVYQGKIYTAGSFENRFECFSAKERFRAELTEDKDFNYYVLDYLGYRKKVLRKRSSYVNSSYSVMKYLYGAFGKKHVEELEQKDFDLWRDCLESMHLVKGNTIIHYMKELFTYIEDYHGIICKYAKRILPIHYDREVFEDEEDFEGKREKERVVYSFDQCVELIRTMDEPMVKTILVVLVFLGLRSGEVRGLKWKDIDFEKNRLTVHRTVCSQLQLGRPRASSPKTKTSLRMMYLPKVVRQSLEEWKKRTPFPEGDHYLFYSIRHTDGHYPISSQTIKRRIDEGARLLHYPQIDIHELRHSFATNLFESKQAGIKDISLTLGHSSTKVTEEVYIHIKEHEREKVAEIVDRMTEKRGIG